MSQLVPPSCARRRRRFPGRSSQTAPRQCASLPRHCSSCFRSSVPRKPTSPSLRAASTASASPTCSTAQPSRCACGAVLPEHTSLPCVLPSPPCPPVRPRSQTLSRSHTFPTLALPARPARPSRFLRPPPQNRATLQLTAATQRTRRACPPSQPAENRSFPRSPHRLAALTSPSPHPLTAASDQIASILIGKLALAPGEALSAATLALLSVQRACIVFTEAPPGDVDLGEQFRANLRECGTLDAVVRAAWTGLVRGDAPAALRREEREPARRGDPWVWLSEASPLACYSPSRKSPVSLPLQDVLRSGGDAGLHAARLMRCLCVVEHVRSRLFRSCSLLPLRVQCC